MTVEAPVQVNVHAHLDTKTQVNAGQSFNLTAHLPALQAQLADLRNTLPESPPALEQAAVDFQALEGEIAPEKVKPRLGRVREVIEDLGVDRSAL